MDMPTGDGTGVRLTTDLGDIVIGLFTESAPVASENFLNLVRSGFYDGTGFHRVVPGFVIQGGDPEGTGAGGPGYTIPDEEVVGQYQRGIVAMARTPQPDSQGSQFFVVVDDAAAASLDAARTYAIYGRVVEGMDVVDAIVAQAPAEGSDLIEDPVRIIEATVEEVQLPPEPTPAPPTAAQLAADALAARLPATLAGIELTDRATFSSDVILAQSDPAVVSELEALEGADLETLAVARAGGGDDLSYINVVAADVDGVAPQDAFGVFSRLVLGIGDEAETTLETIGGREVTRIRPSADAPAEQVAYGLVGEDVVWFFNADEARLEEVVTSLP
jgi:cyclophilin family peptidyl-prolyl cis-trans isomerase